MDCFKKQIRAIFKDFSVLRSINLPLNISEERLEFHGNHK